MPATSDARKRGGLHRRRIIERPRLLALLNGSPARVRTLIAPAGYGKTTLAEQWVGQEGRRHAWFTARSSSTDVAALALGLARAATAIVPDCDLRLREHLRALPAPAEHVDVLAELIGEDLADWPEDAWLVLDDYHEIGSSREAEAFVEELAAAAPIQLLIAGRQRPSWITARKILYGGVLELNQTELAMDGHEAAEVLTERNAASASGLVALADGWPAVIGLASVSVAEIDQPDAVPEALYEFFAEEVFAALPEDVQSGLGTLATAPVIDRSLATTLLGDCLDRVCSTALDVGVLVERGAQLEIHPLARAFIDSRRDQGAFEVETDSVERCLTYFRERKEWDTAFDLITRWGYPLHLEQLLEDALDDLLEMARLSTIEKWCSHAKDEAIEGSVFSLGRAEVALRRGQLAAAQAHAEAVDSASSRHRFRGLMTAGRAAHLASFDVEALGFFRRAERAASTDDAIHEARWGQVLSMTDLEMPEAVSLMRDLAAEKRPADPREAVRAATHALVCTGRFGAIDLADADRVFGLLPAVTDPLITSSYLCIYGFHLGLAARYSESREIAGELLDLAHRYRFEFALPFAFCAAGIANAGLRNWGEAERMLRNGLHEARAASNEHGVQCCLVGLLRTLAQRGRHEEALALTKDFRLSPSRPVPVSMRIELVGTHALVLAASDRLDEATEAADSIRNVSSAVESEMLLAAVDAIVSVKRHESDAIDRVSDLARTAFSTGALDFLVVAYRAAPALLAILLRLPDASLHEFVRRIGDQDLVATLGHSAGQGMQVVPLTPRERDVHELLEQGLTNREIARVLVISEGTAKRHVQNIYDKTGVRSRKAIAVHAAIERAAQATSAIADTGAGTGS